MPRQGDEFNHLVSAIENAISGGIDHIEVSTNVYLKDKKSGSKREHDILIRYKVPNRDILTAIECKELNRKIGSPQVEAFHNKCMDTGIDKGVIVSAKGFSKPAINKANHYGVQCLSLFEAENVNWCHAPGIVQQVRVITSIFLQVVLSGEKSKINRIYFSENGEEKKLSDDLLLSLGKNALNQTNVHPKNKDEQKIIVKINNVADFRVLGEQDRELKIKKLFMHIKFNIKEELVPFSFFNYTEDTEGGKRLSIARASLRLGGFSGDLIISHNPDKGGVVSIVPSKDIKLIPLEQADLLHNYAQN